MTYNLQILVLSYLCPLPTQIPNPLRAVTAHRIVVPTELKTTNIKQ